MLTPLNTVLISLVALTTAVVMVGWHIRSGGTWVRYPAGRSVMGLFAIQFIILSNAVVSSLVGRYEAKPIVYAVLYAVLELAVLGVGLSIITASKDRYRRSRERRRMNTNNTHVGKSTQEAHPWRAAVRTVAAYVVVIVPALVVAIPVIQEQMGDYLPESWSLWLTGAAGFLAALVGLVTRLMALEKIQTALSAIGLSTGADKE